MSWACQFPDDLMSRALGLVTLTGLNVIHNAVHSEVWDSFVNRRRDDRVPLKFVNLPSDYEYPKCKTKVFMARLVFFLLFYAILFSL